MRFVILEHHWNGVHYDLMFELGPVLRTWKLSQPLKVGQVQTGTLSFDHRLSYLYYEGPVSGDRGHVVRWDAGEYEGDLQQPPPYQLRLNGKRLKGQLELQPRTEEWMVRFDQD